MTLCIRQATIADPRSAFDGQTLDLLIDNGRILAMASSLQVTADREINVPGLTLYPGFTDCFSHFNDPGSEQKETLASGAAAAAAGGYVRVLVIPNTQPAIHNKSLVRYVADKGAQLPAQVIPLGALTQNCEGRELAEMYDMYQAGTAGFTDGLKPLQNSQVMLKALQYVKAFDGVVVQIPDEESLSRNGLMHEGIVSTRLGLPGKPALAETLMLARDIDLLRYTGSRLHVTGISSAESVALIRQAKAEGLGLTCSVTQYHLMFTDEDLQQYDTNFKVNPPLRTAADREALRQAVADGTIDAVASHHLPQDWDSKVCEFEFARYGMQGLETAVAAVCTAMPRLNSHQLANLFALAPARIFNLPCPVVQPGEAAQLSLIAHQNEWTPQAGGFRSASANNAFTGKTLSAKPFGTITGTRDYIPHS